MLLPRCEGLTLALAGVVAQVPSREPLGYLILPSNRPITGRAISWHHLAPDLKIAALATRSEAGA